MFNILISMRIIRMRMEITTVCFGVWNKALAQIIWPIHKDTESRMATFLTEKCVMPHKSNLLHILICY